MDIILSASIIAAFIAGMVALFAPCCITILLPAYLASAFREKKNMLKMTFVFFAGISVIIVPIGLGVAGLAQLFRDFHKELYILGGLFMIFLAFFSISGKGMSFPMPKWMKPKLDIASAKSVFVLGLLSGAATSCCAPVLAGAMTLAVISGVFWKAIIVVFAYVFGMVFPLFIAAYFYDKFKIEKSRFIQGKILTLKLGTKKIFVHSTNLIASIIFIIMGGIILALGLSGNAFWSPELQAKIGIFLNKTSENVLNKLSIIPDIVWGIAIVGIFVFLIYKISRNNKK